MNSDTWFQKVSIITKNSGADPNTLNNTANKRAIRYFSKRALDEWNLGSRKIKMQDSQRAHKMHRPEMMGPVSKREMDPARGE